MRKDLGGLDEEAKARYAWSLRFTPAVAISLVVIKLFLQLPIWLAAMALVALTGALWPDRMLIDLVYNHGVRHIFHAAPLHPPPSHVSFPAYCPLPYWRFPRCPSITGCRYWGSSWECWWSSEAQS